MSPARRSVRRRFGRAALVALALALLLPIGYLLTLRPPGDGSFDPVAWAPAPGFRPSVAAEGAESIGPITPYPDATIQGPEDLVIDDRGGVLTGTQAGTIVWIDPSGETEIFADVGGRPLGLAFDDEGGLLVANHGLGLQRVTPDGEVSLLAEEAAGTPILSANDVAVGRDGTIYLSDSSPKYNSTTVPGLTSYSLYDFLEGRPTGRVISYDPRTGVATELITGLYFPNGILLAEDEASIFVTESTRFQITRHWLAGPRSGEREPFLENVPGILDGITRDDAGHLYLSMYDRVDLLDRVILPSSLLRPFAVRVPPALLADRAPLPGSILVLDDGGAVLRHVTGFEPAVSNVAFVGETLLLGTLEGDGVRALPWCEPARSAETCTE